MRRIVVAVLIAANLLLLAAGLMTPRTASRVPVSIPGGDGHSNDPIRVVRDDPEPVSPAPPIAVPRPLPGAPEACLEFGALSQEELARAYQVLGLPRSDRRAFTAPVSATTNWWVYVPPRRSRDEAERDVARLSAAGVRDTYLVLDSPDMRYAISLGIFRTEDGAHRFVEGLRGKGVDYAVVGARQHQIRLTQFYLRNPSGDESRKLLELRAAFPTTEVRTLPCPG